MLGGVCSPALAFPQLPFPLPSAWRAAREDGGRCTPRRPSGHRNLNRRGIRGRRDDAGGRARGTRRQFPPRSFHRRSVGPPPDPDAVNPEFLPEDRSRSSNGGNSANPKRHRLGSRGRVSRRRCTGPRCRTGDPPEATSTIRISRSGCTTPIRAFVTNRALPRRPASARRKVPDPVPLLEGTKQTAAVQGGR